MANRTNRPAGAGRREPDTGWMHLGTITAPWGVRGEVKVRLEAEPDYVKRIKHVYIGAERRGYDVLGVFQRGHNTTLKLRDVPTIDVAEQLRGLDVTIPRAEAPPLPAGHFFHEQIIGLRVLTVDGGEVGRVTEILSTGANDVYIVRGRAGEILIPAIRSVVVEIDPTAGVLRIEPMPGLLPSEPSQAGESSKPSSSSGTGENLQPG